jgi:3D (Asp-Asp-Asp) domain-containing protein
MKNKIISVVIILAFTVVSLASIRTGATGVPKTENKQQMAQDINSGNKEIITFDNMVKEKQEARKITLNSSFTQQKKPVKKVQIASNFTPTRQVSTPERKEQPQVSRGYTRTFTMVATGYTEAAEENYPYAGQPSYIGIPLGRGVVAVDPNVIPMGTKLYVEGYGEAIAADQGGAIRGNRIDLFFDSKFEADNWGMRTVKVYIR